jgi:adenine-specific DNA-methyltransferase
MSKSKSNQKLKSNMSSFSEFTIKITNQLSKKEKKDMGIFITPKSIFECLYEKLIIYIKTLNYSKNEIVNIKTILEPACGTCEIVNYLNNKMKNVEIDGIELNETIYSNVISSLEFQKKNKNKVSILKENFLSYNPNKKYDLIFSNPPYFVCKKEEIPDEYKKFIVGRPNIFWVFIIHGLSMLKLNGFFVLILPKSFLNSSYYSLIRNYIMNTCKIVDLVDFADLDKNNFLDTSQETIGMILQKIYPDSDIDITDGLEIEESNIISPYSIKINNNYIFSTDSNKLEELFKKSTTLSQLGLKVKTGTVVWNQHKDILTSDPNNTILIYNSNISSNNHIEIKDFKNEEKHQYINMDGSNEPIIVVNRGNGNSSYKLNYAFIENPTKPYLIENHLNIIYFDSSSNLSKNKKIELFKEILQSFQHKNTQLFIESYLGNNGLSKTELETIFPIYIDTSP